MSTSEQEIEHKGGCHCGRVKFSVLAPSTLKVVDCNCSICTKKQNRHFVVPKSKFTLLKGDDVLTTYTFNTGQAKHTFCSYCGVQSFYIPRSNQDGYGIMPHCIEPGTIEKILMESFNGTNWEKTFESRPDFAARSSVNTNKN